MIVNICYNFAGLRNEYYYGLPWDLLSEFDIYFGIYMEASDFWYVQVYYNLTWGNLFIGMFISN